MKDLQRDRIVQAREALTEARELRNAGMDVSFVLNNLYLAFYYPVLALVYAGGVPDTMQSVTIGLFEQRFVLSGKIDSTHLAAVRRMFDLKPKCSGGCQLVAPDELDRLFDQAAAFIELTEALLRDAS